METNRRNFFRLSGLAGIGLVGGNIFNASGQEQLTQRVVSAKTQLDLSGLAQGVYTIRLLNNDRVEVRKFVKE